MALRHEHDLRCTNYIKHIAADEIRTTLTGSIVIFLYSIITWPCKRTKRQRPCREARQSRTTYGSWFDMYTNIEDSTLRGIEPWKSGSDYNAVPYVPNDNDPKPNNNKITTGSPPHTPLHQVKTKLAQQHDSGFIEHLTICRGELEYTVCMWWGIHLKNIMHHLTAK